MAKGQKQITMPAVAGHILSAAWQESGRMAKVIWLIGLAAPLGLATLAGRTKWPILGWAANLFPWWGWLIVAGFVALAYLLFYVGARGADLKAAQEPRLEIQFDKSNPLCFHETFFGKGGEDKALYIAVLPRALSVPPIKACTGYLNAVWQLGDDKEWHPTPFVNRQILLWGEFGLGQLDTVDIDSETNQVLNIFFVKKQDPRIHPCIPKMLNKDKAIFHERNSSPLKFDIVLLGDGGVSAKTSLRVQLGDEWNDIQVEQI